MTSSTQAWISAYAALVGEEVPTEVERESILALAGIAARASERTAAPIACWLAAAAGLSAGEAIELAQQIEPATAEPDQ